MATPSTGPISLNDINVELGISGTTLISLNDSSVRTLAGPSFSSPSTIISLSDLRGKSSWTALSATGGTTIDSGGFRIHVFTSPGTFTVSNAGTEQSVEYLVVAGGGGGSCGNASGGGGGAGGFRTATGFPISASPYPVTVGAGGSKMEITSDTAANTSTSGNDSSFSSITSTGGGRGAARWGPNIPSWVQPGRYFAAASGGSGGGGYGFPATAPVLLALEGAGNSPPTSPSQGNPGGPGSPASIPAGVGGGGGGAGGSGNGPGVSNASGGNGLVVPWMPSSYGTAGPVTPGRYFAGGGGGGGYISPRGSNGGLGGGGAGGWASNNSPVPPPSQHGVPGTVNTGGGGGAGGTGVTGWAYILPSGSGGSGIVAIRYPITAP